MLSSILIFVPGAMGSSDMLWKLLLKQLEEFSSHIATRPKYTESLGVLNAQIFKRAGNIAAGSFY